MITFGNFQTIYQDQNWKKCHLGNEKLSESGNDDRHKTSKNEAYHSFIQIECLHLLSLSLRKSLIITVRKE